MGCRAPDGLGVAVVSDWDSVGVLDWALMGVLVAVANTTLIRRAKQRSPFLNFFGIIIIVV
jgi:hypothetical protein